MSQQGGSLEVNTMKQQNQYGNHVIDSLSLALPTKNIQIIDSQMALKIRANEITTIQLDENGELLSESVDNNPRKNADKEICTVSLCGQKLYSVFYKVTSMATGKGKQAYFMQLSINSKHIEGKYFDGITNKTIQEVYSLIMAQHVIKCSFDDFLSGRVTDMDIKQDYNLKTHEVTEKYYSTIKQEWTHFRTRYGNKQDGYTGFSISDRSKKHPFLKVYSKLAELNTNSRPFKEAFLDGQHIPETRVECTLRNTASMRKYGLLPKDEPATLENVILYTILNGDKAMSNIWNQYITEHYPLTIEEISEIEGVPPTSVILSKMINVWETVVVPLSLSERYALCIFLGFVNKRHHKWIKQWVRLQHEKDFQGTFDTLTGDYMKALRGNND